MQTEARFRYATEWDGSDIPARSDNGTVSVDLTYSDAPRVTIYAPEPVNKGQVDLTIEQVRELVAQFQAVEKIIEANAKANRRDAA